ncbi:copper amine oxidase N-terminal domain-containing protein [Paenibacillus polysaccharolyticus]|uniref:stalk domain-containing protein n=1 Tax=Paenibacillus polysaccharolyticus TaxID=582692 RepID=UPI00203C0BA8|nr:stalk domain-containing protein [Paenibacillus polysaccharolyticus]MCM3134587.1 copper amine oxidase N-terminal domain-containing protein [Paenibacillus polysaccharolyticus]
MKKMFKKLPTFLLGAVVGITFTGATAVGAATYLKATQSNVKVIVDGTQAKLSDSPLNVNGRLYLPVRDTANAMGYSVESVTSSQVSLKEGVATSNATNTGSTGTTVTTPSNNTNETASKKVKNLRETYSTDGKLDPDKIRTALNNGTLDVNSQDSTNGNNTLLMYVIEENNYEAYKAIKRNALDVNVQRDDGKTALMLTVISKNDFYFGEMTNLKADAKLKDNSGKQAIDYADDNSTEQRYLKIYMM